jgi:hypothetical protein
VYCNNSVHCDFSRRTSYPAPEIEYSRSNSKRKFPGWKFPPLPYHITQTVAATGFRAYERYANRQKSTRERARERESTGGECERKTSLPRKNVHDKAENERGEGSELYTKSLLYVDEWTNFQLLLSFIHSFIHSFILHLPPIVILLIIYR